MSKRKRRIDEERKRERQRSSQRQRSSKRQRSRQGGGDVRYRFTVDKDSAWKTFKRGVGTVASVLTLGKMARDVKDGLEGIDHQAKQRKENAVMKGLNWLSDL